jgi:mannose-6-phosphate isomerase-like protein (cupin superfamily)
MIEQYFHEGDGYNPFLIRQGWQVAQLNYQTDLQAPALHRVECHRQTDEVFILFQGRSVLVVAEESPHGLRFECVRLQPGVTYNIPAGVWHAIAMEPRDMVIIVENANTHLNDVTYRDLKESEYRELQEAIAAAGEKP